MQLNAFIFDIGNVLLRFDFNVALRKLQAHDDPAAERVLDLLEPIKNRYESGGTTRTEFQRQARAVLRYTGSDADFASAWQDIFTPNVPMLDLVESLHGRFPLYLLSNTSDLHLDYIVERYPFFARFTDAVYSYKVRAAKPSREIYEIAARQFGVVAGETLFIDDLLVNVEAARDACFLAHHYHYERHGALLEELAGAGVHP